MRKIMESQVIQHKIYELNRDRRYFIIHLAKSIANAITIRQLTCLAEPARLRNLFFLMTQNQ